MVKRISSLASNEKFQVRFLVELLRLAYTEGQTDLVTGTGWKPHVLTYSSTWGFESPSFRFLSTYLNHF
jgi:hypothetical protein